MEFVSATPNFLVLNTEGNWLLQELEADGMPAHKLPIESKSKDITGAFPLSHAQTYVWEQGNVLDDRQIKKQYASSPAVSDAGNN